MDIYLPGDEVKAVVLYLHGGGFRKGSPKEQTAPHLAEVFAGKNIAVAASGYRLNGAMADLAKPDRALVRAMKAQTLRSGLGLSPRLYGAAFALALMDASGAVGALRQQFPKASITLLGMSAGGILGLSLAHPPAQWQARLNQPDAVFAVSAAMVQPWSMRPNAPPCVMLHGSFDRIIPPADARLACAVAQHCGARVDLIETGVKGHVAQLGLLLTGRRHDGRLWIGVLEDLIWKTISG